MRTQGTMEKKLARRWPISGEQTWVNSQKRQSNYRERQSQCGDEFTNQHEFAILMEVVQPLENWVHHTRCAPARTGGLRPILCEPSTPAHPVPA